MDVLRDLTPWAIGGIGSKPHARLCSDATGFGDIDRFTSFDSFGEKPPTLLAESAGAKLRELPKATRRIYVFELLALVAAAHQLLMEPAGRGRILFAESEAALAALTEGAAALFLVYSLW